MSATNRILLSLAAALLPFASAVEAQSYTKSKGRYKKSPISINVGSRHSDYTRHSSSRSIFRDLRCRFEPGHHEFVSREIWVQGRKERVSVEPVYEEWFDNCGIFRRRMITPGGYEWVHEPGYFKTVRERVWVPGRVECRNDRHRHRAR